MDIKFTREARRKVDEHVGGRLRYFRWKSGLSQQTLGEQIGITFQQIQKYERGTNRISASTLHAMSQILGAPVESFFAGLDGVEGSQVQALQANIRDAADLRAFEAYLTLTQRLRVRLGALIESLARS